MRLCLCKIFFSSFLLMLPQHQLCDSVSPFSPCRTGSRSCNYHSPVLISPCLPSGSIRRGCSSSCLFSGLVSDPLVSERTYHAKPVLSLSCFLSGTCQKADPISRVVKNFASLKFERLSSIKGMGILFFTVTDFRYWKSQQNLSWSPFFSHHYSTRPR